MERNPNGHPPVSSVAEQISPVFNYNADYRIIICQRHQCVVVDAQINRHLSIYHHEDGLNTNDARVAVREFFQRFSTRVQKLEEIAQPASSIDPIPGLAIQIGLQCRVSSDCHWIGRDKHRAREHCQRDHGYTNPGQWHPLPWATVSCQQFTSRGPSSQLFAVKGHDHEPASVETTSETLPPAVVEDAAPDDGQEPESHHDAVDLDMALDDDPGSLSADPAVDPGVAPDDRPEVPFIRHVAADPANTLPSPVTVRLMGALVDWQRQCLICRFAGIPAGRESHLLADCPRKKDVRIVRKECEAIQASIGQPPASTCPHCLLPTVVCRRYPMKDGSGSPGDLTCQFPTMLLPAVVSAMLYDVNWDESELLSRLEEDGVDISQAGDVHRWLGGEVECAGIRCNRICQHFFRIAGITDHHAGD